MLYCSQATLSIHALEEVVLGLDYKNIETSFFVEYFCASPSDTS